MRVEKRERIEKLLNTPELVLDGNAYVGKYELNATSAEVYLHKHVSQAKIKDLIGDRIGIPAIKSPTQAKPMVKDTTLLKILQGPF